MSTEQTILEKIRQLPPDKQQEVLDFVESLQQKTTQKQPLRDPEGLWADLGIEIAEEDLAEARREMWGNFPRDNF
jgi:hypothetical protein